MEVAFFALAGCIRVRRAIAVPHCTSALHSLCRHWASKKGNDVSARQTIRSVRLTPESAPDPWSPEHCIIADRWAPQRPSRSPGDGGRSAQRRSQFRARLEAADGKMSEWHSKALPAYQRRTKEKLSGRHEHTPVGRALAALFRGSESKNTVSQTSRKLKGGLGRVERARSVDGRHR